MNFKSAKRQNRTKMKWRKFFFFSFALSVIGGYNERAVSHWFFFIGRNLHVPRKTNSISFTTTWLSEIQAHQLHHVRFEKIHIPPRNTLGLCEWTCVGGEERWGRSVDSFLRNSSTISGDLHGCFASGYVENCKKKEKTVLF